MKNFYILTVLVLGLYIWYFYFSDNNSEKYYKNLTSDRVALPQGFHFSEKGVFDVNSLYIETPGEYYDIKYKQKPSDSLYVYHYYLKSIFTNPLSYFFKDKKLTVQLDPKLKVISQPERQELLIGMRKYDRRMDMLTTCRVLPQQIELSPFTTLELTWDFKQKVKKLDLKLDQGAVAYLHNMDIDTLYLSSNCNSKVNLIGSSINYIKHHLEGGTIESKNTTVHNYDVYRSATTWCTASVDLDVTNELSGTIESTKVTRIRYPNDPKINLIKQSNTKIRKGVKQDYAEIYKEMMKKYNEKKLKNDGRK